MEELRARYDQLLAAYSRLAYMSKKFEQADLFADMIDARNTTSHVYNQETANLISKKIVTYYACFAQVIASTPIKLALKYSSSV
jgi:hypothetical protein